MDALSTLEYEVQQVHAQAYLGVAGFCLIVYDILMTWDIEINLVWPARLSLVKVLFLLNRYAMPGVYLWVVYSLVLLRVYALYNRDKRILALLSVLLALELTVTATVSVWASIHARDEGWTIFASVFDTCVYTVNPISWLWIVFLFMILYDVTVFILILRKTWQHVSRTEIKTSLLSTMLVDGLWYFLVMLIGELLNLIAFATFPSTLFLVGLNIMWCMNATMVSRIYLNLRNTANPQDWTELTAFKRAAQPDQDAHIVTFGHGGRPHNRESTFDMEEHELGDLDATKDDVPLPVSLAPSST